jgi:peptide chain release factor subunit 1
MTKDEFARGDYLNHELRKKIVGVFDTCYTNESGLQELVRAAKGKISDIESEHQKELFDEFLKELARDTGKAIYGIDTISESIEHGSVAIVLISSNRNTYVDNYRDKVSRYSKTDTKVEIIATNTESGNILETAFGGIVAIKRYT